MGCSDLQPANPPDFVAEPPNFLPNVTDPGIRRWALDVHSLWNFLTRQVYLLHDSQGLAWEGAQER